MSHSPASENEFGSARDDASAFRKSLKHINELMRQGGSLSGHEKNCLFLNTRSGPFATAAAVAGFDFDDDGRGAVTVDWDGDGDLDLWTSNRTSPRVRLLRNDQPQPRSVSLLLKGRNCNRDAVGARVRLFTTGDPRPITKTVRAGEGYLSQSTKWLTFGLGRTNQVSQIEIDWPGGNRQTVESIQPGRYQVDENSPPIRAPNSRQVPQPMQASTESEEGLIERVALTTPIPCPALPYDAMVDGAGTLQNALKGSGATLVNLWASWCRPCLEELKELSDRFEEVKAANLKVVAISVDTELNENQSPHSPTANLSFKLPFKNGQATSEMLDRLKAIHGLPFAVDVEMPLPLSFLVSASNKVVAIYRGRVSVDTVLADVATLQSGADTWQERALPLPGRWNEKPAATSMLAVPRDLLSRNQTGDALRYLERFDTELQQDKELPLVRAWLGDQLIASQRAKEGLAQYKAALAQSPNDLTLINNYAWQLATQRDATLRNGKLAVQWSLRAAKITGNKNAGILDTLAASYAEAREFEKAVVVAQTAMKLAPDGLAKRIGDRLSRYQRGLPYHE